MDTWKENSWKSIMETQIVQTITKDMTIGDIVTKHPECIETLLSYGVHCIGCHVSYVETLEQGFRGHGISDETIAEAIQKINAVIGEHSATPETGITISEKAASKLKEILKEQNKEGYGLRVQVVAGGCSGNSYGLDIEEKPTGEDIIFEKEGVKVFIDPASLKIIGGSRIDYVDALQGAGFRISNPHAKNSCGCGNSFS